MTETCNSDRHSTETYDGSHIYVFAKLGTVLADALFSGTLTVNGFACQMLQIKFPLLQKSFHSNNPKQDKTNLKI